MNDKLKYINNEILKQAKNIKYSVADLAPSNEIELFNTPSLVIWSGSSDTTIFQDANVNYAFRALHDTLHLTSGYDFSPKSEIALGRLQAAKQSSSLLADLVYCEVSRQAEYYLNNSVFVSNQIEFTKQYIKGL